MSEPEKTTNYLNAALQPDETVDSALRPLSFDEFTGQTKSIERLQVMVNDKEKELVTAQAQTSKLETEKGQLVVEKEELEQKYKKSAANEDERKASLRRKDSLHMKNAVKTLVFFPFTLPSPSSL